MTNNPLPSTLLSRLREATEGSRFHVGKVRQMDWLLAPRGFRDGVVVGLGEPAKGTPHRWLLVEFKGHTNGEPFTLRLSTALLTALDTPNDPTL